MTSPLELHTELIALEENDVLVEDERVEPSYEGPLGVRSLVELCRGKMMRLATRYADIGDLQYAQHELFFRTRPVEQLAELEDNSPDIKVDTDHLWADFLQKEDPEAHAKNLARPVEERKSWRKIYFRTVRKAAEKEQAEWSRIKEEADEEDRAKKANKLKVIDRLIPSGSRRRGGGFRASAGFSARPTSIVEKARKASAGRREIMDHANSASSSAPRRTGDPFRGSTILATPGSKSTPQTKLPPLPRNRIQRSDHEMPPAYSVMPLLTAPTKSAASKLIPMKNNEEKEKKRVADVAFFEDSGVGKMVQDKPAKSRIQPREINVVKTVLPAQPPVPSSKLPAALDSMTRTTVSRPDEGIIDVEPQSPSKLTSAANVAVASGNSVSTPPRPKPAVPLNSLFMPKKKRKA